MISYLLVVEQHRFFLNDPAPTKIYPLSLHDALPISAAAVPAAFAAEGSAETFRSLKQMMEEAAKARDRKSTRLNSSHSQISYAVFCLKKKKIRQKPKLS